MKFALLLAWRSRADIGTELNKIIDNGGEGSYTDKSLNKIFVGKADKKFGIFQECAASYPVRKSRSRPLGPSHTSGC